MNKLYVTIAVIVIIVLIGTGVFLATKKSNQSQTVQTPTQASTSPTNAMQEGSLKSLLALTGSQMCTYSSSVAQTSVSGTAYIANGKMRGDYTSNGAGQTVSGHMLLTGGYTYVWTDASKQGIKVAVSQEELAVSPVANSQESREQVNLNQKVSYHCSNWAEDSSKFAVPTDITFSTITIPSVVPSTGSSATTPNTQSACSACNSLPLNAKAQCMAQLHCQ